MKAIETNHLIKKYTAGKQSVPVLKGLDLQVSIGEFIAIMGPSGSGKSTLLHLLGGLDNPSDGEVKVGGKLISGLSEKERTVFRRQQIGFVFQDYQLLPAMTVEENIAFPLHSNRTPRKTVTHKVSELLDVIGLQHLARSFPSQLSGGQQQRVAIARAMAMEPPLLLADEPTGNLDRKGGHDILQFISHMNQTRQMTVVMVTHDLHAACFADRVVVLRDGLIVDQVVRNTEVGPDAIMASLIEKLSS